MGIVKLIFSHFGETRSEEVGENEKEQETNNKCLECNKEFGSIEELRVHEKNCYICEQCNNWYESREDLEDHRRRKHIQYSCTNSSSRFSNPFPHSKHIFLIPCFFFKCSFSSSIHTYCILHRSHFHS